MKKIIIMALMAVAILPTYAESTVTTIKTDGLTNSEKKEKKGHSNNSPWIKSIVLS